MPESEEALRHNYLKRTEATRKREDLNTSPLTGLAHVFWGGDLKAMIHYVRAGQAVKPGTPRSKK